MKKLIAGNWKMNGKVREIELLCEGIIDKIAEKPAMLNSCEFLVCPSFVHIPYVIQEFVANNVAVSVGAQDCSAHDNGAFTGEISASMLVDMGCEYVILGHSERRSYHGETSEKVAAKAAKAHEKGLKAIICVGESEDERIAGKQEDIVGEQLEKSLPKSANGKNTVIAYEPVWAIGTGKTATPDDIAAMHSFIREKLSSSLADSNELRILYGGSMKAQNAAEIFSVEHVHGGLIGGASLKAEEFAQIAKAV